MPNKFNLYLGKAGHLAMMAEFLMRGWNVAIPEVDIGDDIFVVQDELGTLKRVQVKTAKSKIRKSGYSAQFQISVKQLYREGRQKIYYAFLVRQADAWGPPIIIRQDYLRDYVENYNVGTVYQEQINIYFSYSDDKVICSKQDFTMHLRDYSEFLEVSHNEPHKSD